MIAAEAHLPIVCAETFEAAQARFTTKVRGNGSSHAKRSYLFSGMVRCCAGHRPLSMYGKARKGHRYYACAYAANYGDDAALEAHGGQKWISVREDWLEQARPSLLRAADLRADAVGASSRSSCAPRTATSAATASSPERRIRKQIAELERKIKAQVQALEKGIEPELVSERIAELRAEKEALEEALAAIGAEREEAEDEELAVQLARVPDLDQGAARGEP